MSEEKKLTMEDPVSLEVLTKLQDMASHRGRLCEQYVDLENEKVRLQVAIRQLDQERARVFERLLVERGLDPTATVEIDAATGKVTVIRADVAR